MVMVISSPREEHISKISKLVAPHWIGTTLQSYYFTESKKVGEFSFCSEKNISIKPEFRKTNRKEREN